MLASTGLRLHYLMEKYLSEHYETPTVIQAASLLNYAVKYTIDAYYLLVNFISYLLQTTVFKADPTLATQYGQALTLLISLTAIYIILAFVSSLKKIIGIVIALGWILVITAMVLTLVH